MIGRGIGNHAIGSIVSFVTIITPGAGGGGVGGNGGRKKRHYPKHLTIEHIRHSQAYVTKDIEEARKRISALFSVKKEPSKTTAKISQKAKKKLAEANQLPSKKSQQESAIQREIEILLAFIEMKTMELAVLRHNEIALIIILAASED